MDLTSIGVNNLVYINDILCMYYKILWRKWKTLGEQINSLILVNEWIHQTENCCEWWNLRHYSSKWFPGKKRFSDKAQVLMFYVSLV